MLVFILEQVFVLFLLSNVNISGHNSQFHRITRYLIDLVVTYLSILD